jgi:hypothetical protein
MWSSAVVPSVKWTIRLWIPRAGRSFDQAGMTFVILDHDDGDGSFAGHAGGFPSKRYWVQGSGRIGGLIVDGQCHRERGALARL